MGEQPPERTAPLSVVIRKWAIRIGIAALVFEIFYLVAANAFLRTGLLTDLINKKPEKMNITWDSAVTYLPGFATVSNFELRSQTRKDQIYLRVAKPTPGSAWSNSSSKPSIFEEWMPKMWISGTASGSTGRLKPVRKRIRTRGR